MEDLTTDQLTRQYIESLQAAWQRTQEELERQRDISAAFERKLQEARLQQMRLIHENRIHESKLQLSDIFTVHSDDPFRIMLEIAQLLPKYVTQTDICNLSVSAMIRIGESWVAVNSNSSHYEEVLFRSTRFDSYTRYKLAPSDQAENGPEQIITGKIGNIYEIVPEDVAEFLINGSATVMTAEPFTYEAEQGEAPSKSEEALLLRTLPNNGDSRVIFAIVKDTRHLQSNYATPSLRMTVIDPESTASAYSVSSVYDLLELLQLQSEGTDDATLNTTILREIMAYSVPLILSSVVNHFQRRQSGVKSLRQELVSDLRAYLLADLSLCNYQKKWREVSTIICAKIKSDIFGGADDRNNYEISAEILITNFDADKMDRQQSDTLLLLSSDQKVQTIQIPPHHSSLLTRDGQGLIHNSFEDAMHTAVRRALCKHRPYAESYSKINSLSKKVNRNSVSRVYEHHAYLAIPLKNDDVMGVILVQIVFQQPIYDNMNKAADHSLVCPYSAEYLHMTSSMLNGEVAGVVLSFLKDTNYRSVSLFSKYEHEDVMYNTHDGNVVEGLVQMLTDQSHLEEFHSEGLQDFESKSSVSFEIADVDQLQDDRGMLCSKMIDRLRVLLDSDWVSVLVTSSTSHNSHSKQHFHHPTQVLMVDNDQRYHRLSWQKLPKNCRHIFYHLLHDSSQPQAQLNNMVCSVYEGTDISFGLQDVIDLLQVSDDLIAPLHQFSDVNGTKFNSKLEAGTKRSKYYSNQVILLRSQATSEDHMDILICHGRMFRRGFQQMDYSYVMQLFSQACGQHQLQQQLEKESSYRTTHQQEKEIMATVNDLYEQLLLLSEGNVSSNKGVRAYRKEFNSVLAAFWGNLHKYDQTHGEVISVDVALRISNGNSSVSNYLLDSSTSEWTYFDTKSTLNTGEVTIYEKVEKLETMSSCSHRHISLKMVLITHYKGNAGTLLPLPFRNTWCTILSSYIESYKSLLLYYPTSTRMTDSVNDSLQHLLMQCISSNFLHGDNQLTHAMSQSFIRPYYHLHDYLHKGELLHSLANYYPLHDFIILPITAYPGSKAEPALNKLSTVFKLLLQVEASNGKKHDDEQLVGIPSKLSQAIHIVHNYIEQRLTPDSKEAEDDSKSLLTGYQAKVHQQFSESILQETTFTTNSMSLLCELPEMSSILCNYLYELNDHLQGDLFEAILGKQHRKPSLNSSRDLNLLETFIHSESSKVLLYSPFYPMSLDHVRHSSAQTVKHLWTTHFLLISRPHAMITTNKMESMQTVLDEVYKPSHIIAAGQPWFECVKGIEQLLITATESQQKSHEYQLNEHIREYDNRFLSLQTNNVAEGVQDPVLSNSLEDKIDHIAYHQVSNILSECLNIAKLSLSDLYMGSVSYILPPTHACLLDPKQSDKNNFFHELIQTDIDYNYGNGVHKRMKHEGDLSLGPKRIFVPANSYGLGSSMRDQHMQVTSYYNEHHHLEHFEYAKSTHSISKGNKRNVKVISEKRVPQIHYIEMSMTQYQQQLQNYDSSFHNRTVSNTSRALNAKSEWLLRDDVKVLQIYVTAWFDSEEENEDELSALNSISQSSSYSASTSPSNIPEHVKKAKLIHDKVIASMVVYLTPDSHHQSHALKRIIGAGIWANIMRVVDITGVLVSSVYVHKRNKSTLQVQLKNRIGELEHDKEFLFKVFHKIYDLLHYYHKYSRHHATMHHSIVDGSHVTDESSTAGSHLKDAQSYFEKYQNNLEDVLQMLNSSNNQVHIKTVQKLVNKLQDSLHSYGTLKDKHSTLQQEYQTLATEACQIREKKEQATNFLLIIALFFSKLHHNIVTVPTSQTDKAEENFDINLYSEEQVEAMVNYANMKKIMLDYANIAQNYKTLLQMSVTYRFFDHFLHYVQCNYQHSLHRILDMHNQGNEDVYQVYLKVLSYLQDSDFYESSDENLAENDLMDFNPALHGQQDITKHMQISTIWCHVQLKETQKSLETPVTNVKSRPFPLTRESFVDLNKAEVRDQYAYAKEGVLVHEALEACLSQNRIMHSELIIPVEPSNMLRGRGKNFTESRIMHVYYQPVSITADSSVKAVLQLIVNPLESFQLRRTAASPDVKSFMQEFFQSTAWRSQLTLVEHMLAIYSFNINKVKCERTQLNASLSPWQMLEQSMVSLKGEESLERSAPIDSNTLQNISLAVSSLLVADCSMFIAHNPEDFNELMYHFSATEPVRHLNHILTKDNSGQQEDQPFNLGDSAHSYSQGKNVNLSAKAMTRLQQILKQYDYSSTNIFCAAYEFSLFADNDQREERKSFPTAVGSQGTANVLHYVYYAALPLDPTSKEYIVMLGQIDRSPSSDDVHLLSSIFHVISLLNTSFQQRRHISFQNQNINALSHSLATQSTLLQSTNSFNTTAQHLRDQLEHSLIITYPTVAEASTIESLRLIYAEMNMHLFNAVDRINSVLSHVLPGQVKVNVGVFSESTLHSMQDLLSLPKHTLIHPKYVHMKDMSAVYMSNILGKKQIETFSHYLYQKDGVEDSHNILGTLSVLVNSLLVNDLYTVGVEDNLFYLYLPAYSVHSNKYLDNVYYIYVEFSNVQDRNQFVDQLQHHNNESKELAFVIEAVQRIRLFIDQNVNTVIPVSISNYLDKKEKETKNCTEMHFKHIYNRLSTATSMLSKVLEVDMKSDSVEEQASSTKTINSICKIENISRLVCYSCHDLILSQENKALDSNVELVNVQLHYREPDTNSNEVKDRWYTAKPTLHYADYMEEHKSSITLSTDKYQEALDKAEYQLFSHMSQQHTTASSSYDIVFSSSMVDRKIEHTTVSLHHQNSSTTLVSVLLPVVPDYVLQIDLQIKNDDAAQVVGDKQELDVISSTISTHSHRLLSSLAKTMESKEGLQGLSSAITCNLSNLLQFQLPFHTHFYQISSSYLFNIKYLDLQSNYIVHLIQQLTAEGKHLENMLVSFQQSIFRLYYGKLQSIQEGCLLHHIHLLVQSTGQEKAEILYHKELRYNSLTKDMDLTDLIGAHTGNQGQITSNTSEAAVEIAQTPRAAASVFSPLSTSRTQREAQKAFNFEPYSPAVKSLRLPSHTLFSQNSTVNNAPQTTTNTKTQSSVFAYAYTRNDDNITIANNSSDNVIEIIFECHEIYGKLSIGFAEYPSVEGVWAAELSLWEQLSRPLARRIFELHRGKKNKELMQSRGKELQRKSSELAEQGERLSSLEHVNTMTHQELQALVTESERLRKILKHEQQQLQLTIQSKKQLNDHLKLTLQQVKEDFSKKEQQMQQEQKSLQHKVHKLQTDLVKKNSELSSYAVKEQLYKENKQTLLRQYESLLHQHEASEKHLLGLRKELGALEKQYSSLEVSEEVKMKALVGKIRGLEEEIDRQRGNNTYLKKQLDSVNKNLQLAQADHSKQLQSLQQVTLAALSPRPAPSPSPSPSNKRRAPSPRKSPSPQHQSTAMRKRRGQALREEQVQTERVISTLQEMTGEYGSGLL